MADHVLTDTLFESFQLHPLVQQGLVECGFTHCTPIQALTLPEALAGHDVAGQAQTGTGKTCAFLVSLMQHLLTQPAPGTRDSSDPRALIIAPTRELAIQIDKDARAIGAHTGLEMVLIYGGVDYDKQRQALKAGCDIIIATPGRLLDYYKQHVFRLESIEVMVVDEADRMFDLGFIKDVRYIFRRLPPRDERQVLLYSATLSYRVLELAYEHMHQARKLVAETDHVTADKVRQVVYFPSREEKLPLLLNLMLKEKPERALVFVNTRAQTERVRDNLRRHGYRVGALSGDVPQEKRQRVLKRFKAGELDMLVCTDVAARGLHIPHVTHVFNYDLPQDAEDYVHRIGRTARLGEEGDAISFACDLYAMSLPDIEAFIGQKIPVRAIDPELLVMPEPVAPARARATKTDDTATDDTAPAEGQHKPRRRRRPGSHAGGSAASGEGAGHGAASTQSPGASGNHQGGDATASEHGTQPVAATAGGDAPSVDTPAGAPRNPRRRNRHRSHAGHGRDVGQSGAQGATSARAAQPDGHHAARRAHSADGATQQHDRRDATRASAADTSHDGRSRPSRDSRTAPKQPAATSTAHRNGSEHSTEVRATPVGEPVRGGFFTRLLKGVLKVHKETTG